MNLKLKYVLLVVASSILICAPCNGYSDELQPKKVSNDFTAVAKKAIPAVVSIKVKLAQKNPEVHYKDHFSESQQDPFGMFNDDFFKQFFGLTRPKSDVPVQPQIGQGSGFIISDDGFIITNSHVVREADTITVQLNDGREFSGKVIGQDASTDVALIKIEGNNLPTIKLGNSEELEIGQWVIAIGNPLGLHASLTVGVVSAIGRSDLDITHLEDFIQTDAAINRGNSGGPLLNLEGEVVGVNTAIASNTGGYMGIGFAIPSTMVHHVIEQLMKNGKVSRGYIGVNMQKIDNNLAQAFKLEKIEGGLITDVVKGSPAERAGLTQGDIIVRYNQRPVESIPIFRNAVALSQPGTKIALSVKRNDQVLDMDVEVVPHPDHDTSLGTASTILGFEVEELTPEIAQNLGYLNEKGVIISKILPNNQTGLLGLKRGSLIVAINKTKISTLSEFHEAVNQIKHGDNVLLLIKEGQRFLYVAFKAE